MRTMSRIWTMLVVGASLGVALFWSTPAKAAPLILTQIDWDAFTAFADTNTAVGTPFIDFFDFEPSTTGGDGEIYSAVFAGKGSAAGKYVYVYQVYHYSTSSAANFTGFAFQALTNLLPDGSQAFYIVPDEDDPDTPPIGTTANQWGSKAPNVVDWSLNPPYSDISVTYAPNSIGKGKVGYLFGFVHPIRPTMVQSNPKDAGPDILSPLVYTPSPEPSAFILLGTGLLGLLGIRRRYLS